MENIDIRDYIINNFKDDSAEKIRNSIDTTIEMQDEDALIGLGVLFELVWKNLTEEDKNKFLNSIHAAIINSINTN